MMSRYFYGPQSDMFSFYRIPRALFRYEKYRYLSAESKVLYGLLLARMDLSAKNGWLDDKGRVYIIYTVEEIMECLNCGNKKACQLLSELEKKGDLIERRRQGLGRPNLIYVLNFVDAEIPEDSPGEEHSLKCQNDISGSVIPTSQDVSKRHGSNKDISYTENRDNASLPSGRNAGNESEGMRDYHRYEEYFRDSLELDILEKDSDLDQEELGACVDLMVEICTSRRKTIRINREDMPAEAVRSRFMKLNSEHIRYALMTMNENTTRVRDMKQYMLAVLYNAPTTIHSYYRNWVNHDRAAGRF